jgi:hypothetical protein
MRMEEAAATTARGHRGGGSAPGRPAPVRARRTPATWRNEAPPALTATERTLLAGMLDPLTPEQQDDRPAIRRGEQRLALAVLEDALWCVRRTCLATKHARVEGARARDWLQTDAAAPFAFGWVCDVLALDADYIRGQVARLTVARLPRTTGGTYTRVGTRGA